MRLALLISFLLLISGCDSDKEIFTLYRNSPIDSTMRIYVATFDGIDGEKYNAGNCDIAA